MITRLTEAELEASWLIEQQAHLFPWQKNQLEFQLKNATLNFGYWLNNQLQGFILLQNIFPEAEILNIAVHPAYQGKKIGRTLLNYSVDYLSQRNYTTLYLEVRRSNCAAIHLYEINGFNQMGERKNYYPTAKGQEDALLYGKELCY